jgi:hypothetical protein
MHLFYARNLERRPDGATFRNARHFTGLEAGGTEVTVDAEFDGIAEAYRAAGVPVTLVGGSVEAPAVETKPAFAVLSDEERAAIEIPDDWSGLPWPQLRRLAQGFSAEPVLNKAQATAAVEAELARRVPDPVTDDEPTAE